MRQKIFAMLLVCCLVLTMIPSAVFAQDATLVQSNSSAQTGSNISQV